MPKMHQNTFAGRTLLGPTGGAYVLSQTLSPNSTGTGERGGEGLPTYFIIIILYYYSSLRHIRQHTNTTAKIHDGREGTGKTGGAYF